MKRRSREITIRPVSSFPGYFADSLGNVYSARRGSRLTWMKPHPAADGYLKVTLLNRRGRPVHCMLSKLVCSAFHGASRNGSVACHVNGDRLDNRPVNLRWGSRSSNERDKVKHGTSLHGHRNVMSKLSTAKVRTIRRSKATLAELGRRYGVAPNTIWRIRAGRLWPHVR